MRRLAIAVGIAVVIYGIAVGAGALLYATGAIATGATHNNCDGVRSSLATERGIAADDVPQHDVAVATQACLDSHELTQRDAFRSEYLLWSLWPAVICAAIFLLWPAWARVLHRQEEAELAAEASRLEMGQ